MHKLFAEWYRIAGVEPRGEDLPKRWSGVEAVVKGLDVPKTLDVARLYLGARTDDDTRDRFATAFQTSDPAFPMRGNELELRVLAGAVVAHCVESGRTGVGTVLTLAVVSGACRGLRKPTLIPEIVTIAETYLFSEGLGVRTRCRATEIKAPGSKAEQGLGELKTAVTQNDLPALSEALVAQVRRLNAGIGAVAESAGLAVRQVEAAVASALEQANVLWWLFAGTSRELGKPYRELPWPAACLVAGKELADLTELLPGPVAAVAVLDKILSDGRAVGEPVSLGSAVAGLGPEWIAKCLEGAAPDLDDLCPAHSSLRMSTGGTTWAKQFQAASGISPGKANASGLTIASQMYNERLLQKAMRA